MKPRFLYIIECAPDLLKVGCSAQPEVRLTQLWREAPDYEIEDYTLLATVPGSFADERVLHDNLARYRCRGEWYIDCSELRLLLWSLGFDIPVTDRSWTDSPVHQWMNEQLHERALVAAHWR